MKKIISLILTFVLIAATLISCVQSHDHVFSETWTNDSDYHWHACTAEDDCSEQGEKAAHDYEVVPNAEGKLVNLCKVCGYFNEKVSTAPAHDHVFSDEYVNSENFHWHECTVEGCFEADKSNEHQYGNPDVEYSGESITMKYTCVDCGYIKEETSKHPVALAITALSSSCNARSTARTAIVAPHPAHIRCPGASLSGFSIIVFKL